MQWLIAANQICLRGTSDGAEAHSGEPDMTLWPIAVSRLGAWYPDSVPWPVVANQAWRRIPGEEPVSELLHTVESTFKGKHHNEILMCTVHS
jgi:hypothetical protein